jgi:hypothetical protein
MIPATKPTTMIQMMPLMVKPLSLIARQMRPDSSFASGSRPSGVR